MNPDQAIAYMLEAVRDNVENLDLRVVALNALMLPGFKQGAGGSRHHHAYEGGLAVHTAEVVQNALSMAGSGIDKDVLVVAAVWHDVGKIYEYRIGEDGKVSSTERRNYIGHLVESVLFFCSVADQHNVEQSTREHIVHCMLAHHGRREWGSPVEPYTAEAFVLHSADMLSMQENKRTTPEVRQ